MKIAVATCLKYHDAIPPFLALFRKFWPDCPYELLVIDDRNQPGQSWCSVVNDFAASTKSPVLLFQEDFWLNAPVNQRLVERAEELLEASNAAMVRLYPCPGGTEDFGDTHYAAIPKGTMYRVSCQVSLWNPRILAEITSHCNTPAEFEIDGSRLSNDFDEPFLAFKRELRQWPLSYYCSAISRGKYEPDALEFCALNGIAVDTSRREIACA